MKVRVGVQEYQRKDRGGGWRDNLGLLLRVKKKKHRKQWLGKLLPGRETIPSLFALMMDVRGAVKM
jgi:hypothetical protein